MLYFVGKNHAAGDDMQFNVVFESLLYSDFENSGGAPSQMKMKEDERNKDALSR